MATYNVSVEKDDFGQILKVGFGDPATNAEMVAEVEQSIQALLDSKVLKVGGVLRINGPASLPVAFVICHKVSHLFSAVAVFDPKVNGYIVAIAHGTREYKVGDVIPA